MKIISLSFCDTNTKWNLSQVKFKNLTLLVGASGVGKTQILQSILKLRAIANGKSISGTKWEIVFSTLKNKTYKWIGEYEKLGKNVISFKFDQNNNDNEVPNIKFEKLYLNDKIIIERNKKEIKFNDKPTVKLAQDKSVLHLLKEEKGISEAYNAFKKINYSDQIESKIKPRVFNPDIFRKDIILKKYNNLETIRESDENIVTKLYLAYNNAQNVFNTIKDRFIDIFPFVLDIRFSQLETGNEDIPSILKDVPFIQIKEKNVDDWVIQPEISSGMYRTLLHISELFLSREGTVVLIDEFENSLGVNCINELTEDLQTSSDRNLQYIITSHHPYIINNINFKNWKLVTRNGNEIRAIDAADIIDFNKSKQQAFVQLTQLEEFTTGIAE